ncbi:MAG: hypothetical protein AAF738_12150, partial [Bacteroidota bacterium]
MTDAWAQDRQELPYQRALVLYQQGEVVDSYELAWQGLETTKLHYGGFSTEYANHLHLLSLITASLYQDSLALLYTLQEIKCREYLELTDKRSLLKAYQNAANLHLSLGNVESARKTISLTLLLADSVRMPQDSINILRFDAAKLYQAISKRRIADSLYTHIEQQSPNSLMQMQARFQQWSLRGEFDKAKAVEIINTLQQRGDTTTSLYAEVCYRRANMALHEAEWQDARQWYEVARRFYEK